MFDLLEVTAREVVSDDDIGTAIEEFFDEKRADEACAPGNEGCLAFQSAHTYWYSLTVNNLLFCEGGIVFAKMFDLIILMAGRWRIIIRRRAYDCRVFQRVELYYYDFT